MLGECPNFQGKMAEKIRENGPKTGNSFVMSIRKQYILDQNFDLSLLLFIFRHLMANYSLKKENMDYFSNLP